MASKRAYNIPLDESRLLHTLYGIYSQINPSGRYLEITAARVENLTEEQTNAVSLLAKKGWMIQQVIEA